MPSEVVGKLNDLVLKELRQSEVQEAFSTQAATPAGASPAAFAAQIQAEADRWLPIVQAAGIKAN
jgi:tripartite-type tricarboxylate transporter receptor subunit TctC